MRNLLLVLVLICVQSISIQAENEPKEAISKNKLGFNRDFNTDYDHYAGALEVPHQSSWSSGTQAYETANASPTLPAASCWTGRNRWFKFTATSKLLSIEFQGGLNIGDRRTVQHAMAIFKGNNQEELACVFTGNHNSTVQIETNELEIGEEYYISVISYNRSTRGHFGLEISNQVSYDFPEGALEVPHQSSWSSGTQAYETANASPTLPAASCWTGRNRWFKFTATSKLLSIEFQGGLNIGDRRTVQHAMAIFKSGTQEELACVFTGNHNSTVQIETNELEIGEEYYISVISYNTPTRGYFGLEISNQVSYDYPEGAIEVPHTVNWSSGADAYNSFALNRGPQASCNQGHNRWFRFNATSQNITLQFNGGTTPGGLPTDQHTLALFKGNEFVEVVCVSSEHTDVALYSAVDLEVGTDYFISVIAQNRNSRGNFGLSISGGAEIPIWQKNENLIYPTDQSDQLAIGLDNVPEGYSLALDGKAILEEVKVQLSENWPDYVFTEDYNLKSLNEVAAYIKENGHLPNIPSAETVSREGIILGQMNAKLLEKIEELTLYILDQNEKNIKLQNQINLLFQEIEKMKN